MRSVSLRQLDMRKATIPIGFESENLYSQVNIDCKKTFDEHPNAVATLAVKNPAGIEYPATLVRDGDILTWNVTASDLTVRGSGEIQITFTIDGDVVGKSDVARTRIERSIGSGSETPDPIENWIDEANEVLEAVENAIPPSGTTGQVLAKKSDSDYDLEWVDQSGGGGGGTTNYNALSNKPQIGGVELQGNKSLHELGIAAESSIPDVTGKADKVTGGTENNFAALDSNGNIKDSGKKASDFLTSHQDISGKADKVASPVNGNFAGLDSNGNLTDSGKKPSDFLTSHQDISGKADKVQSATNGNFAGLDSNGNLTDSGKKASDFATPSDIPVLTDLIDDTAGEGDTDKVLSADKVTEELTSLSEAIVPLTPSATSGDVGKFLKAKTVSGGKVTEYEFGEGGGGSVTVDDELSDSSTNPVQNKVITGAIAPLIPSATSGDVGKFLKAKTVSDGKVTEYELDDPSVDPADVEQAVSDWLTAHPEATTTVQDGSITKAKLSSGLAEEFKPVLGYAPTYTQTSGKYVDNNGSVVTSQYYGLTSPIAISKGDIVLLEGKGYSTSIAMISLTDENATSYTPVVLSYDSNVHTFTYVAKADGYYACSYNIYSATHTIIQYSKDSIQGVAIRFDPVDGLNLPGFCADAGYSVLTDNASANMSDAGHYIQVDGSYQASGAFKLSSSISLPASSTIQFTAKGYSTNVAVLAKVVNGVYTPLIASTDSNVHTWTYSTTDPVNVVISSNKDTQPIYSVYTSRIDTIDRRLTNMEDDVFAFATMGVIGDSLASGASNHSGGVDDRPVYSWGKYIERVYGVEVSLFTNGGFTTRDWLTEAKGLAALNAADPLDCYVIGLGQNDAFSFGDAYIGSSSDVHVGSEAQNADTYYGNYSKIIAAIKAKSPRAKIFCLTNALPTSNTKLNYNTAVRTIVPLYTETYLVDLAADAFYTSELFKGFWNGAHSTACGYKLVAKNIHDNICDVIRANISEFKDIQWIVENHS